uniref:ATP synthase complex subunit 8 n=1 Tax=Rachelia extrusa TaxID=2930133 RepID=A0A6H0JRB3_9NEOP|nr:ATP synthase F0 subunit 8 [Rachelia extrusa]QIU83256.1 ATP synthase F0 subunit 8 [Rachelia extrusa]
MPQMMPINWMFSFFMFILIFIFFNILNFYIFHPNLFNTPNKIFMNKNKNFLWKW